jgi:hypothetical protein
LIAELDHPQILRFWTNMLKRHRKERLDGPANQEGTRWHKLEDYGLNISLTVGSTGVRAFVRGEASVNPKSVEKKLAPFQAELEGRLGVPLHSDEPGRFFIDRLAIDLNDEANWNEAGDWLFERGQTYEAALHDHLKRRR